MDVPHVLTLEICCARFLCGTTLRPNSSAAAFSRATCSLTHSAEAGDDAKGCGMASKASSTDQSVSQSPAKLERKQRKAWRAREHLAVLGMGALLPRQQAPAELRMHQLLQAPLGALCERRHHLREHTEAQGTTRPHASLQAR